MKNNQDSFIYLNSIELSCMNYFKINNNKYVIIGNKGIFHFNKSPFECKGILDSSIKDKRYFKGGIKINDNYLALTSNSILPNGEDILVFYDIENKKIIETKNKIEFSFNTGVNGLNLMEIGKDKKQILLCACKKYTSSQKNGILIINPEIKENEYINFNFYDTEEFEVSCFCPINIKKDDKFVKTDYFLVGGFEKNKRKGIIKLFKVIYDNKSNIMIKYLEDIFCDDNNNYPLFDGNINCILQSKINGKLLISCWNGKVYLFSEPNIKYYLDNNDKDISKLFI